MADVQHLDLFFLLNDPVNGTINMRLVAVEQVPEVLIFGRYRRAAGRGSQATDCVFEAEIPLAGSIRRGRSNPAVDAYQIALGARMILTR